MQSPFTYSLSHFCHHSFSGQHPALLIFFSSDVVKSTTLPTVPQSSLGSLCILASFIRAQACIFWGVLPLGYWNPICPGTWWAGGSWEINIPPADSLSLLTDRGGVQIPLIPHPSNGIIWSLHFIPFLRAFIGDLVLVASCGRKLNTGISHFIVLCFISFHRCCFFLFLQIEDKTLHQ